MSIKVIVKLHVREDKLEQIRPLFSKLLKGTRGREGNEAVTVLSDQDRPTTIILIEQWASRHHYEQYNKWRAENGDLTMLAALLQEPPLRRFFDYIGV